MKKVLIASTLLASLSASPVVQAAVTEYEVALRFNQIVYSSAPDRDTYFYGSFSFDDLTNTVSNLQGYLSQAMTGADYDSQQKRFLSHQLASVYDEELGGLLVSTFYQDSTDVFQGGGFQTGGNRQFGNQNAYVTIFVDVANPAGVLTTPTSPYVDYKLAYGDCTTGSLMGGMGVCMTGWLTSTGTMGGTMQGVDLITQTISPVPEPETYAMLLAGLGLIGAITRRRKTR
ncbi:MAG: PEPxxWA-CTERM sorting domain-containing protein [Parazoarcus communis]